MKNKLTLSLQIIAVGLLLTVTLQSVRAQQPVDSRNATSETKPQYVTIKGAVSTPGRFELRENMRLNILLTLAGGWTEQAEGTIRIDHFLRESKTHDFEVVEITDILAGKANPYLKLGDVVTVEEAKPFYVIGSVVAPQTFLLRGGFTLSRAIAMAGGTLKDATKNRIRIYRASLDRTSLNIITVDLKAIRNKRAEDITLQPYDIIEVPSKNGDLKPPVFVSLKPVRELHGYKIIY